MSAAVPPSDEELIRQLRAGDDSVEQILLERYKPLVLSRARAFYLCGGDREDLVQEGMIGCYKAICRFDESRGVSFTSFADLCIRRQISSAVKLGSRKKHEPLNSSVSLDLPISGGDSGDAFLELLQDTGSGDPEKLLLGRERIEEVTGAINTMLSRMEKKVLDLYIQGYSYQAIADRLAIRPKSVDNAIQRVKAKLECYR